jgi:hypothetical protein
MNNGNNPDLNDYGAKMSENANQETLKTIQDL